MPSDGTSKVSVCMPVYNGASLIAQSIRSVLSQTYTNFNLIVCDNCSTDNTADVVRSFDDPRITYHCNEKNLGLVGNANRSLELADGQYVNILHHDDIMLPENLEKKVRILDENPSVGFVHSDVGFIDQDGAPLELTKFDADRDYIVKGSRFFEEYILKMPIGASVFIGAVMARRDCYRELGGFNPEFVNVNDSEMWMRMMLHHDVACIGERLVKYRLHSLMTSTAINDEEGLNLPGLKEHYIGSKMILDQHKDRIPDCRTLKKSVKTAFSVRALGKGIWHLHQGRPKQGLNFLMTAFQFEPAIVARASFWNFLIDVGRRNFRKVRS